MKQSCREREHDIWTLLKRYESEEELTGIVRLSLRLTLQGKTCYIWEARKTKHPEQDVCLAVRTNLDRIRVWCLHHGLRKVGGPVWKQRAGVTDKNRTLWVQRNMC